MARNLALAALLLAGGWILWRGLTLGNASLWLDEILMTRAAAQASWARWWAMIPDDKPPLDYLVLRLWGANGKSEAWLRAPAAVFGALTAIPVALLAALLLRREERAGAPGRRRAALAPAFAAALLLSHPLHAAESQEVKPYAAAAFWLAWSALGAVLWLEAPGRRRRRGLLPGEEPRAAETDTSSARRAWIFFAGAVAASLLACLTSFTILFDMAGLFAGAAWAIFALPRQQDSPGSSSGGGSAARKRRALLALSGWALLLAGALALSLLRLENRVKTTPPFPFPPAGEAARTVLDALAGADTPLWLLAPALALELALFALGARAALRRGAPPAARILLAWWGAGWTLALLTNALKNHWLAPRYFTTLTVPFVALQALGAVNVLEAALAALASHPRRRIAAAALLLAVAVFFGRRAAEAALDQAAKPDYRGEVQRLASAPHPSLCLASHRAVKYCYDYYRGAWFHGAPECAVWDPASGHQARQAAAARELILFPLHLPEIPPAPAFSEAARRAAEGADRTHVLGALYKEIPAPPPLPPPGESLRPGDEGAFEYFSLGWGDLISMESKTFRWAGPAAQVEFSATEADAARIRSLRLRLALSGALNRGARFALERNTEQGDERLFTFTVLPGGLHVASGPFTPRPGANRITIRLLSAPASARPLYAVDWILFAENETDMKSSDLR